MDALSAFFPTLLAWFLAQPLRVALGLLAFGLAGVTVAEAISRLTDRDEASRRGWRLSGIVSVGAALWAGAASLTVAAGPNGPQGLAALPWAIAAAAGALTAAAAFLYGADGGRAIRVPAAGLAAVAQASGWLAWRHVSSDPAPPTTVPVLLAIVVGSGLAAGLQIGLVVRSRRRVRRPGVAQMPMPATEIVWAAAGGLASALPGLLAAGTSLPGTAPTAPAAQASGVLLALMAVAVQAVLLIVVRVERQLRLAHGRRLNAVETERAEPSGRVDLLTGLPDRVWIEGQLATLGPKFEARGERLSLMLVCLDGFRTINEAYGHKRGDEVLRDVAKRLKTALEREADGLEHRLARAGGDEFIVLVGGALERAALTRMAEALRAVVDQAGQVEGLASRLSASVGIARFPEDGGISLLLDHAHAARQSAKEAGGSAIVFFEPRLHDDARERLELLRDLRRAVDDQQLELYYQPKIDARSGQVTAAEALLRWHHPTRGMVPPGTFIPIAERYGLIAALGNWVIEDACRHAGVWKERGLKMRVAINLSAYQMRQDDLVERIESALRRHHVNPSRLTCEITETVAMEDTQATQRTFERLGQAGIHLSIDDFGTGYSSLSYLSRLPAAELKIDRSFVSGLAASAEAGAIVKAIIQMAHSLDLRVVAEGVETEAQRDALIDLGCDELQGYLFARPMSARSLLLWALDDRPAPQAFRASLFSETRPGVAGMPEPTRPREPDIERISLD